MKPRMNDNGIKYLFASFIIACLLFTLFLPGCNQSPSQLEPAPANTTTEPAGAPRPAIEAKLTLSHAPKVGETAEAILTVIPNLPPGADPRNVRAWLEFSRVDTTGSYRESQEKLEIASEKVITESNLNWEGILSPGAPLEFRATVRFSEEGTWEITGYVEREAGLSRSNRVRLAVEDDRAGIYGSEAYRARELEWMEDYSPSMGVIIDSPITATLDLSNPPRLGEPAELTWSIVSTKDVAKAKVWTEFKLMEWGGTNSTKLAGESILTEGDLSWEGILKKDVPVSSTATLIFSEEGDWEVVLICDDSENTFGCSSVLLNVTEESGRWGWVESHEIDLGKVPPPKPVEESREGR